jgi:colanic acid/amylovoran biosynthesis glycosyltransferase
MKLLQNIKIGLVLPSVPGYSETFFRSKINGLQENGATVTVFVANAIKSKEGLSCKIVHAPKLNGSKLFIAFTSFRTLLSAFMFNYKVSIHFLAMERKDRGSLNKCLKKLIVNHFILRHKLDWLHFGFGTMALGRENAAEAIQAKMAVSFRGFDIGIYPLKHPNCYKKLFQKVDKIHVISNDISELLQKQGLENTEIITKITPAIDSLFFKNVDVRENSNINLLTVGRLHWKKGIEYTLEALSILDKQGINFHYTVIGDGSERERLVFAVHQLGLEKKVTFAGKLVPDIVKAQLEKSSIYLQYSIQEGFCNAVLEAQAMGLLCIVSDAEGLSENVLDGQTGWVVPKRNPQLFAKKIMEVVLLSKEQKTKISTNAVNRVKAKFNIEKQTQEFVNFYRL